MAGQKKVLILYASAGHGHEKAAKAVEAACQARGCQVECLDMLVHSRGFFGGFYRWLYLVMIKRVPGLWGLFYHVTDLAPVYFFIRPVRRLANRLFAGRVERVVAQGSWDIVVSTHFMGCEIAAHVRRRGRTRARLLTVITDYLPHAFWLTVPTDLYCVAADETASELARRGIPASGVLVTGIPIEAKFSAAPPRETARARMGLDAARFVALLTSGGAGIGTVEPLVDRLAILEPPMELLVVCGTNDALRLRLASRHRSRSNLHLFGFVDNIPELMAASDLVVGKGGGLTVTESLALSRPMVLIGAVPGQETRNVEVACRRKAASLARSTAEAVELVQAYRKDAAFYRATLEAIARMRRPDAAPAVAAAALEGA